MTSFLISVNYDYPNQQYYICFHCSSHHRQLYSPPMLRTHQHSTCKHSHYTKCHPLMCWISRFLLSSRPPVWLRSRASSKRSSLGAKIFSWTSACNDVKEFIPAKFLTALKDTGKSRISSLLGPLKGLNRSLDLVTVWLESRAIELCSLYSVNVPKRYHKGTENLHSHNPKFHLIDTLSHIDSKGDKTGRKSFESFEALRNVGKSSRNVISKCWEVHSVCHRRNVSNWF